MFIPENQACTNCQVRYRQDGSLCRKCLNATGEKRIYLQRESEYVLRRRADLAKCQRRLPPDPSRVIETKVIGGQLFDVKWNGT